MSVSALISQLGRGALTSFLIFALTFVLSIPIGVIICLGRMSHFKPFEYLSRFVISLLRGTPLILQLLAFYFLPYYLFGMPTINRFLSVILTFSVNYAAYFAEIFRAGYMAIPLSQRQAAKVLSYSKADTFFIILLPQIVKKILPAFSGEVVTLSKDTALASTLGVIEMYAVANKMKAASFSVIPIFAAGAFYFVANWVIASVFSRLEKHLSYYSE